MGPLFVLAFWIIIASVSSLIGGIALSSLVSTLTRNFPEAKRKHSIRIARYLPAACAAYLFVCVIVISIWSTSRGKDMGWGDDFETPILGSYGIEMIDVADSATVYEISDPDQGQVAVSGPGRINAVAGVTRLEVRPPYLLGAANPRDFIGHPEGMIETAFFIVDTKNRSRTDEPSLAALQAAALKLGEPLHLEPVGVIYDRYRWDRQDLILLALLALPPPIVLFLLARAQWMARRAAIRNQSSI